MNFGWLTNSRLVLPFKYFRVTCPPPFPPLKHVAYQEGTPLLGPLIDPYGWYSQGPVHIQGKIFNSVNFTAQCTVRFRQFLMTQQSQLTTWNIALYLKASPCFYHTQSFLCLRLHYLQLAYSSGSFIPLFIRIECNNEQALDLLSNPKSVHVRVRRQIIDHTQKHNIADNGSFRESLDYSQRAVWWESMEEKPTSSSRLLNGELHLKPGMKPNTELGHFKLGVRFINLFMINYFYSRHLISFSTRLWCMTSVQLVSGLKNRNTSKNFPSKYARSTPQDLVRNRLRRTTAHQTCLSENLSFLTMKHFLKDFTDKFIFTCGFLEAIFLSIIMSIPRQQLLYVVDADLYLFK